MAEGTIRITSEPIQGTQGFTPTTDEFELVESSSGESSNGTPRKSAADRRKEKRAQIRVTDRSDEDQSKVDSQPPKTQSKRTPASQVKKFMAESEALTNAKFYLAALEWMGISIAGANGEMTEFERTAMTPALRRTLQRIPIAALEKSNIILDSIFLGGGMIMYCARISGSVRFPRIPKKKGTQEDTQAPVAAPTENTVKTVQAGDIDGIAIPVPDVFQRYMNGNI
jgi:hypothetical protein